MEVMDQALYEIYRQLMNYYKETVKDVLATGISGAEKNPAKASYELVFAYALLKACRMKAVLTEKYEDAALAIYEKYSDVSEKDAAEFALCYSEAVRNRDYQDYGRNNGGRLWS